MLPLLLLLLLLRCMGCASSQTWLRVAAPQKSKTLRMSGLLTKSVSLIISMSKKASRPGMGNHLLTARLTHREPRLSFANHGLRVPTSTNADNGALRPSFASSNAVPLLKARMIYQAQPMIPPSATMCPFTNIGFSHATLLTRTMTLRFQSKPERGHAPHLLGSLHPRDADAANEAEARRPGRPV
ncbi:hypothetical protein HDK64DRAFT_258300 [Phyllosticta capitalensis]